MFKVMLSIVLAAGFAFADNQQPADKEVVIGVHDAYVPGGFDSQSDVFVVASGLFPNGCYRWKRAEVSHKSATEHEVQAIASVSQGMCLMVLVPFTKEIRLGVLGAGEHTVRIQNGDGTYLEKKVKIEE